MNGEDAKPVAPTSEGPRPDFDVDEIHKIVARYFRVYEVERDIKGIPTGQIAAYYIQTDPATFNERFDALREAMRAQDPGLLVILQHRLGEDVVLVARKPPVVEKGPTLNIVLLILTILTTTISGALFYQPLAGVENLYTWGGLDLSFLHPTMLFFGFLTFSLPLILILGVHELGHYFVARRHHVHTSLPYFIPVPPIVPIGTFGAFISMKEPIPDRKALFDIGASGPIAGFLLAIPVLILGLVLTAVYAVPVPPDPEIHASLESPVDAVAYTFNETDLGRDETHNKTFEFGYANFTTEREVDDDVRVYRERIEFVASNGTLPSGQWRAQFQAYNLTRDEEVEVTVRLEGAIGNATPDFSTEDDGAQVANVDRELAEAGYAAVNYSFTIPPNATRLVLEFEWEEPPSSFVRLGDSLLFYGISYVVDKFIPVDENVFTHPTGIAGWVGLLVTGFNLLPAGQLDGGHVARAVLGERMRWASYASVAFMFLLSFQFPGWIIMAILIVFLGLQHPPPLNDKSPLDPRRRVVATLVLLLLLTTFVPFPFVRP